MMGSSNEEVSRALSVSSGIPSNLVSPLESAGPASSLTSPASNLDRELEKLLLEEAKKQGLQSFDAVRSNNFSDCKLKVNVNVYFPSFRALPKAVNYFNTCSTIPFSAGLITNNSNINSKMAFLTLHH